MGWEAVIDYHLAYPIIDAHKPQKNPPNIKPSDEKTKSVVQEVFSSFALDLYS